MAEVMDCARSLTALRQRCKWSSIDHGFVPCSDRDFRPPGGSIGAPRAVRGLLVGSDMPGFADKHMNGLCGRLASSSTRTMFDCVSVAFDCESVAFETAKVLSCESSERSSSFVLASDQRSTHREAGIIPTLLACFRRSARLIA